MALISRPLRAALVAAALAAVAQPLLLLRAPAPVPAEPASAPGPLAVPKAPPPLDAAYARPLFGAASGEIALPADAPRLTGIVGRIGRDAVAFAETAQGESRTLALGESIDGWRLESLAIDAAYFTRGTARVRVPLPAGEDQ